MNKVMKVFLTGGFLLGSTGLLMAATGSQTYTISTTVPAPSSVSISANQIPATTPNATGTPVSGSALSFDPLTYDTTNNIYSADHFFAINVGPAAGSGSTSVVLTYTEGANPNAATGGSGLGQKTVATFTRVSGATVTALPAHGGASGKKLLNSLSGETVTSTEIPSGSFRLYLGIETNPTGSGEPAGAQVFSATDKAGAYTGSLVVSATVV